MDAKLGYIVKVWYKGDWSYLARVESEAVVLTPRAAEAERFRTERDAECSAVYLPEGTTYRINVVVS